MSRCLNCDCTKSSERKEDIKMAIDKEKLEKALAEIVRLKRVLSEEKRKRLPVLPNKKMPSIIGTTLEGEPLIRRRED